MNLLNIAGYHIAIFAVSQNDSLQISIFSQDKKFNETKFDLEDVLNFQLVKEFFKEFKRAPIEHDQKVITNPHHNDHELLLVILK